MQHDAHLIIWTLKVVLKKETLLIRKIAYTFFEYFCNKLHCGSLKVKIEVAPGLRKNGSYFHAFLELSNFGMKRRLRKIKYFDEN